MGYPFIALPRMEKKFEDLIIYLTTLKEEEGHQAQHSYNSLPKDSNERVLKLIELIPIIRENIDFYKAFPDGNI